jgi:hypothetical protein
VPATSLFETRDAVVEFPGLDASLDEHLGR